MPASGTERDTISQARKEYKCIECKKSIHKDDKYWRFEAYYDGIGWETFHTCLRCKKIRKLVEAKYCNSLWDEPPAFGELYWFIREAK